MPSHHHLHDRNTDVVRLGEHDYNNLHDGAAHQDFGVVNTVLYPDYNPPQAYHDLALLRLDSTVNIQVSTWQNSFTKRNEFIVMQ